MGFRASAVSATPWSPWRQLRPAEVFHIPHRPLCNAITATCAVMPPRFGFDFGDNFSASADPPRPGGKKGKDGDVTVTPCRQCSSARGAIPPIPRIRIDPEQPRSGSRLDSSLRDEDDRTGVRQKFPLDN